MTPTTFHLFKKLLTIKIRWPDRSLTITTSVLFHMSCRANWPAGFKSSSCQKNIILFHPRTFIWLHHCVWFRFASASSSRSLSLIALHINPVSGCIMKSIHLSLFVYFNERPGAVYWNEMSDGYISRDAHYCALCLRRKVITNTY